MTGGPHHWAATYSFCNNIPPMELTQQIAMSGRQLHAHRARARPPPLLYTAQRHKHKGAPRLAVCCSARCAATPWEHFWARMRVWGVSWAGAVVEANGSVTKQRHPSSLALCCQRFCDQCAGRPSLWYHAWAMHTLRRAPSSLPAQQPTSASRYSLSLQTRAAAQEATRCLRCLAS